MILTRRKYLQCLGRNLFIVGDDAFPYQTRNDDSEPADLKISIWSCTHHLSQVEWSYGAAAKDVGRKGWRMPAPHRWRSGTWGLPASTGCQRGITWMILRIFYLESNSCRWIMIVYNLYLTIKIYQGDAAWSPGETKYWGVLVSWAETNKIPLIHRAGTGCISHLQARRAHQWRCNWSDRSQAGMNDVWKREKSGCKKRGLKEIDHGGSKFYCKRNYCLTDCDELHVRLQAENVIRWLSSTWTTEREKCRGHTTSYFTWIIVWMVMFHENVLHHQPNPRAKRRSISWHGRRVDSISLAKWYTIAFALWFLHPSNRLHKTTF